MTNNPAPPQQVGTTTSNLDGLAGPVMGWNKAGTLAGVQGLISNKGRPCSQLGVGQNIDMAIYRHPSSCGTRIDTQAPNVDQCLVFRLFYFAF